MAASRRRAASNKGEQALLVLRHSGFVGTLQAVRQFAVSKSIALSPYSDTIPEEEERLSLDAATARRIVEAIRTVPPPSSTTAAWSSSASWIARIHTG